MEINGGKGKGWEREKKFKTKVKEILFELKNSLHSCNHPPPSKLKLNFDLMTPPQGQQYTKKLGSLSKSENEGMGSF